MVPIPEQENTEREGDSENIVQIVKSGPVKTVHEKNTFSHKIQVQFCLKELPQNLVTLSLKLKINF